MIRVVDLTKSYGKLVALDHVSFTLSRGIHGLLGPNGSGKTTLFRCLANVIPADSGVIDIPSDVGYLPQRFGFYKGMRVNDVMALFASLKKIPKASADRESKELIERVHLADRYKSKVGELSGGMLRRLGIAIALLGHPELLLIDEPTAGLDPEERLNFKNLITSLGQDHAIIVSTHIVEDVESMCDQIIIMYKGKILTKGTQSELTGVIRGKVYEIEKNDQRLIQGPFHLVREFHSEGKDYVRILTDIEQEMAPVRPTIEDAYLSYIRKI